MVRKQRKPESANSGFQEKSLSVVGLADNIANQAALQAARLIAQRFRLPLEVAQVIIELSGIAGGRP